MAAYARITEGTKTPQKSRAVGIKGRQPESPRFRRVEDARKGEQSRHQEHDQQLGVGTERHVGPAAGQRPAADRFKRHQAE